MNENKSEKKLENFFEKQEYLHIKRINSIKSECKIKTSLKDFLAQNAQGSYKVIWRAMNELKFGYYNRENSGGFTFYDNKVPDEKYLINLRLFNEAEEIMIQKNGSQYTARIIKDEEVKSNEIGNARVVDDASTLFGERTDKNLQSGIFVKLTEKGRKISMVIPTSDNAKYYALVTRSYISSDEKTGQAGYGYYRYLDIRPEVKQ